MLEPRRLAAAAPNADRLALIAMSAPLSRPARQTKGDYFFPGDEKDAAHLLNELRGDEPSLADEDDEDWLDWLDWNEWM